MEPFLTYLAPPCVGAFIGYMTNYVAIRMLFRPLKPWRFLGMRLPMTPGVIPAKRHDLAQNIGEMVGSHLLTSSDVHKALQEERFTGELNGLVGSRVEHIFAKDLGPIATLIPNRFQAYFTIGMKVLKGRILKYIHNYLQSDPFGEKVAVSIEGHIDHFLKKSADKTLSQASQENLFKCLEQTIHKLILAPETGHWIQAYMDNKITSILKEKKSLNDLLPEELRAIITAKIEQEAPSLLEKAAEMLEEPSTRERIVDGICGAIEKFIATLGPMAALVGGFLDANIIRQKVNDFLGEKSGDISAGLQNDAVREKIAELLREKVTLFMARPIVDLFSSTDPAKIQEARVLLLDQLTRLIQHPNVADSITLLLRDALSQQAGRPLETVLEELFSKDGVQQGKQWTTRELISILRSAKVQRIFDTVLMELIDTHLLQKHIGPLNNFLPKKVQTSLCEYLMQATNTLLIKEVPNLVDSLNIKKIVAKKVDSLDLLRLENLLLSIMQEQFKYINLFGGLLGFLIGLCNLIFIL